MCRILSYLGKPIVLDELLYKPDQSFIKQSYHPKYMHHLLNLAGFGFAAWSRDSHNPANPFIYKTYNLPFYDENLRNLSAKILPHCILAHLRGVAYDVKHIVSIQNVHPFIFPGSNIALAHNGSLYDFVNMKFDLLEYVKPIYAKQIIGTTDSEWIYAIFMSQLPDDHAKLETNTIINAMIETLKILQKIRHKHNITINSPVNLFITNGDFIAATRYVLDYGWKAAGESLSAHFAYHSLWYTYGESYGFYDNEYKMSGKERSSIIVASEPLTEDTSTWVEVPEYISCCSS